MGLAAVVVAAALGVACALGLSGPVPTARAALPCGLLNPCTTTTTATLPPPPPTTTTITTATPPKPPTARLVYAGQRYDGRSASFSYGATVVVTKSGRSLEWTVQYAHGSCSDGGRYGGEDYNLKLVPLSTTGTATETVSLPQGKAVWYTKAGKKVIGAERYTAHFTFHGKRLTGTLTDTFTAPTLTCHSGTIAFTAYLDGTAQAPVRTAELDTGDYRTTGASAYVYVPWHAVTELKASYAESCPKVKTSHYTVEIADLPLAGNAGEPGSFSRDFPATGHLSHGITARQSVDVAGDVYSVAHGTRVSYELRVTISGGVDYYADTGEQIPYVCNFSGSYVLAGPKNLPKLAGAR